MLVRKGLPEMARQPSTAHPPPPTFFPSFLTPTSSSQPSTCGQNGSVTPQ